jgi:hypothetical protein
VPSAYDLARARARQAQGALNLEQAYAVRKSLLQFADRLTIQMGRGNPSVAATRNIVLQQAKTLLDEIDKSIKTGRAVSFEQTLEVWKKGGADYAQSKGVTGAEVSRLSSPAVDMLGAFESVVPAATWKTLLQTNAVRAAQESTAIIREAITEGMGPDELARRLRRYVAGAEKFDRVFGDTIDLRNIPEDLRGAARQMTFNAERIAFSELHNARAEAEIQHFISDPFVEAVKWALSPDRGTLATPDECDYLAQSDFYGLGPGVYPVEAVPTTPHPFDRCEKDPVTRATSEIDKPKPSPDLQIDPRGTGVPFPRGGQISPNAVARARASAAQAIENGKRLVPAPEPIPKAVPKPKSVRLLDPAPSTYLENTEQGFLKRSPGIAIWKQMDYDTQQLLARNSVSLKWVTRAGSKELQELNAVGFYQHATEKRIVIGIEGSFDAVMSTVGHEVGHAVDFNLSGSAAAWSNSKEGTAFVRALEADRQAARVLHTEKGLVSQNIGHLLHEVDAGVAGAAEKLAAIRTVEYSDYLERAYKRYDTVEMTSELIAKFRRSHLVPKQVLEVFADIFNGQRFGNTIRGGMYTNTAFKEMFPRAWKVVEDLKIPKVRRP